MIILTENFKIIGFLLDILVDKSLTGKNSLF